MICGWWLSVQDQLFSRLQQLWLTRAAAPTKLTEDSCQNDGSSRIKAFFDQKRPCTQGDSVLDFDRFDSVYAHV